MRSRCKSMSIVIQPAMAQRPDKHAPLQWAFSSSCQPQSYKLLRRYSFNLPRNELKLIYPPGARVLTSPTAQRNQSKPCCDAPILLPRLLQLLVDALAYRSHRPAALSPPINDTSQPHTTPCPAALSVPPCRRRRAPLPKRLLSNCSASCCSSLRPVQLYSRL